MATQLILTVGTNPLPIWVAWYHLKDKLEQPVSVRFVYTSDTEDEKKRLERYCHGASFGRHIQTSSGNPGTVRRDIRDRIVNSLGDETTHLHIHYTGGTKVMGVETVSAVESGLPQNVNIDTTYLDPRGSRGPCILSRRRILVGDTRKDIDAYLERIALLNGFVVPPFGAYPALTPPTNDQLRSGRNFLVTPGMQVPTHIPGIANRGDLFEYGTYAAFHDALDSVPKRPNYALFQGVHVRRTGVKGARDFELDVVAVLGYQIVLVSCSVVTDSPMVKLKAMEALHRARQLGGDEARAVMLSRTDRNNAKIIEDELKDEMGSASAPLQVWGADKWSRLQTAFTTYLRDDLYWG